MVSSKPFLTGQLTPHSNFQEFILKKSFNMDFMLASEIAVNYPRMSQE